MMTTEYELAARYVISALGENGAAMPEFLLVLNIDRCSAGLCRCNASGTISLEAEYADPAETAPLTALEQALEPDGAQKVERLLTEGEELQRRMWLFYLLKTDAEALPGLGLNCSELQSVFDGAEGAFKQMLVGMESFCSDNGVKLDDDILAIAVIGHAFNCYLFEYAVRAEFSFTPDPNMPDSKIVNGQIAVNASEYVALGKALMHTQLEHDYSLSMFDAKEKMLKAVPLGKRGAAYSDFHIPSFLGPICVADGDGVHLLIDGQERCFALRFQHVASGSEIIEAALRCTDENVLLRIRRSNRTSDFYDEMLA